MAKPKLRLVSAAPSENPRPIAIGYYGAVRDAEKDWSLMSHAKNVRNAARAAFTRVLDRRAAKAIIHDENGAVCARVWRERNSIRSVGV